MLMGSPTVMSDRRWRPAVTPDVPARQQERRSIGTGQAAFEAAKMALTMWSPQRAVGASIHPPEVRPDVGETVVLRLGIGPVQLSVPNRIVAVVDEPDR